jgi:hypothetical protein
MTKVAPGHPRCLPRGGFRQRTFSDLRVEKRPLKAGDTSGGGPTKLLLMHQTIRSIFEAHGQRVRVEPHLFLSLVVPFPDRNEILNRGKARSVLPCTGNFRTLRWRGV